jgi:hypothetical protein
MPVFGPEGAVKGVSILPANISAFWKFEEASGTRLDASPNLNNAVPTNAPTQVTGQVGKAIHFAQASSQYCTVTNVSSLQIGFGVPLCITGWINADAVANRAQGIVSKWGNIGTIATLEYAVLMNSVGVTPTLRIGDGITSISCPAFGTNPAMTTGVWHFFAFWFDPVLMTINSKFDNGATVTLSTSGLLGVQSLTNNVMIGALDNVPTSTRLLDGAVDELIISKAIPTAAQLAAVWNGGAGV